MNRDIPFGRPDFGSQERNDYIDALYRGVQDWLQLPFGSLATQFLQYDPTSSRRLKWSVPAGGGGGGADLQAQINELKLLVIALALGQGVPLPVGTSYDNVGGQGNRASLGIITTTATGTLSNAGTEALLLNGSYFDPTSGSSGSAVSGKNIRFQFPSPVIIDEISFDLGAGSNGDWKVQGSNDGSTWADLSASFLFSTPTGTGSSGGSTHATRTNQLVIPLTSTYAWTYYQLVGISGTPGAVYLNEMEFKIYGL